MSNTAPDAPTPPANAADDRERSLVGSAVRVLGGAAALGAFGLWVWFVVSNFGRLWERVSNFAPGPGRATKLEVGWALVGWAMGPVFAIAIFACLAAGIDSVVARLRRRRPTS